MKSLLLVKGLFFINDFLKVVVVMDSGPLCDSSMNVIDNKKNRSHNCYAMHLNGS